MFGTMAMVVPTWFPNGPFASVGLLVAGGVLLVVAGFLAGVRRKTRFVLEHSGVTQEMMAYLARMTEALEANKPPDIDQLTGQVLRRLQEMSETRLNGKVREIPFSMFGRDYQPEKR
jgi:predicted secreted Zn-dependent protease